MTRRSLPGNDPATHGLQAAAHERHCLLLHTDNNLHLCIQASVHVWPAGAALRVAGTLSLAVGDASCLCTQMLVEPCKVAVDLQRCTRSSGTEGTLDQPAEAVLLVRFWAKQMLRPAVHICRRLHSIAH